MDKATLRERLIAANIYQYQIAEKIGLREEEFSRKLRHDLAPDLEQRVNKAIQDILEERKADAKSEN